MNAAKRCLVLIAAAVSLSLTACASNQDPPAASAQRAPVDDDAYCQANAGTPGSSAYVACRKDRDVGATRDTRMERAHKNLAEDMLNSKH